jgi:hypothetical protein
VTLRGPNQRGTGASGPAPASPLWLVPAGGRDEARWEEEEVPGAGVMSAPSAVSPGFLTWCRAAGAGRGGDWTGRDGIFAERAGGGPVARALKSEGEAELWELVPAAFHPR